DRIVILSEGRLCCAGSSLFLKQMYGTGYNLTLVKRVNCDIRQVTQFVQQYVPEVKILSNVGSEVVLQLPTSSSGAFPELLRGLDQNLTQLQLMEYGISVTTLEEVFLSIAHKKPVRMLAQLEMKKWRESCRSLRINSGVMEIRPPTFAQQYFALLQKRFRISRRDQKGMLFLVAIPVFFLLVLATMPSVQVAKYLPNYAAGGVHEAQNYATCTQILANSTNNTACAFGQIEDWSYCPNCQPYAYGCGGSGVQSHCSQGTVDLAAISAGYPFCAMYGGFIPHQEACTTMWYSHCTLGLADCDASSCCNYNSTQSPYFPCSACQNNKWPCITEHCIQKGDAKLQGVINAFLSVLIIIIGFSFIPASVVVFAVREKDPQQNAKYQQMACDTSVFAYWLSLWTHDVLFMLIPVGIAVGLMAIYTSYVNDTAALLGALALLVIHVLSMLPLSYLFTFRFTKHSAAQTSILVFCLVTGALFSIISFLCRLIDFELIPDKLTLTQLDTMYLRWAYLVFPGYALTDGLFQISMRKYGNPFGSMLTTSCKQADSCWSANIAGCCTPSVFEIDIAGRSLIYGATEAIIFTFLVLFKDQPKLLGADSSSEHEHSVAFEEDVEAEAKRVDDGAAKDDNVILDKLHKQFGSEKIALHQLSLGIPKGECFGYLGINGAGKSTTLQILHGALEPTSGSVSINGHPLPAELQQARSGMGYCPQFDALHDLLTVEEELELYARLKGVVDIKQAVNDKIEQFNLASFRKKRTRGLSGGNKRKVSTAIALLGSPTLLLLDEPSTGMDPAARREMWDVIVGVLQEKTCSVILTTHSMEECQALCTRIGILVSGQLKCLGTAQHLKQKFGRGFTVDLKLKSCDKEALWPSLNTTKAYMDMNDMSILCHEMKIPSRMVKITQDWILQHYMERDNGVPIDVLRQWWALEDASDLLLKLLSKGIKGACLVEHHGEYFRFQIPKAYGHTLQSLFQWMENNKANVALEQYSVSDTTLEEIFNCMAADQEEERQIIAGTHRVSLTPSSRQAVRSYHRSSSLVRDLSVLRPPSPPARRSITRAKSMVSVPLRRATSVAIDMSKRSLDDAPPAKRLRFTNASVILFKEDLPVVARFGGFYAPGSPSAECQGREIGEKERLQAIHASEVRAAIRHEGLGVDPVCDCNDLELLQKQFELIQDIRMEAAIAFGQEQVDPENCRLFQGKKLSGHVGSGYVFGHRFITLEQYLNTLEDIELAALLKEHNVPVPAFKLPTKEDKKAKIDPTNLVAIHFSNQAKPLDLLTMEELQLECSIRGMFDLASRKRVKKKMLVKTLRPIFEEEYHMRNAEQKQRSAMEMTAMGILEDMSQNKMYQCLWTVMAKRLYLSLESMPSTITVNHLSQLFHQIVQEQCILHPTCIAQKKDQQLGKDSNKDIIEEFSSTIKPETVQVNEQENVEIVSIATTDTTPCEIIETKSTMSS
ncbi:ATP-binding Cassette (ABC) Superfamily, partial [Thraustotheca clavata]